MLKNRSGIEPEATIQHTWHLTENEQERAVTELEFALWRVFYGFLHWQESCQRQAVGDDLNGYELALLHIIRMKDKPKTIYEIARLLNRDDANNIQYSVKKLLAMGLVEKVISKEKTKQQSYQITNKGVENTTLYRDTKREILASLIGEFVDQKELEQASNTLIKMKTIYDEASRNVAYF